MAKSALYGISAVKYDPDGGKIDSVRIHQITDKGLADRDTWSRERVVSALRQETSIITVVKNAKGDWEKGAKVDIISVKGVDYIRTDANDIEADNLGELPVF